jgi:hypothetical protein
VIESRCAVRLFGTYRSAVDVISVSGPNQRGPLASAVRRLEPKLDAGLRSIWRSAPREFEEASIRRIRPDVALTVTRVMLGLALVHRPTAAERDLGQKLLAEASEVFLRRGYALSELPTFNGYLARERARRGDRDEAIPLMRAAVDHLFREGQLLGWGIPATGVLVETLLDRASDGDVAEAEAAIDRLAAAPADEDLVMRDIWLLRLRALLARAHGDDTAYGDYRDRYRDMARTLGFEGHIAWAEAMT